MWGCCFSSIERVTHAATSCAKSHCGSCGGSASGKTFLKDTLIQHSPPGKVKAFTLDSYYLPRDWQKADEKGYLNFDLPDALNHQKMILDFLDLTSGFSIEQPVYQYKQASPVPEFRIIEPAPVIIAEGIFVFYFREILERLDWKVFIDAPFDLKRQRRIKRDMEERGYEEPEIRYRFDVHAEQSFQEYVLPYKKEANLTIQNNLEFDDSYRFLLNKILEQ